jgi:hypothetical protein
MNEVSATEVGAKGQTKMKAAAKHSKDMHQKKSKCQYIEYYSHVNFLLKNLFEG